MSSFWEIIQRFGNFQAGQIVADADDKESFLYRASAGQEKLKQICLTFYRQTQEIRSDTKSSPEGHADRIKAAAKKALAELDQASRIYLEPVEKRLEELRIAFKIDPLPADDVTSVLREIEVRTLLVPLDASKRWQILQDAIESKDVITFRAFDRAPSFLQLVNDEIMARCRRVWAERLNPKVAKELSDMEEACAILTSSFSEAYQGIGELGQIIDDSLRSRLQGLAQRGLDLAAASFEQHRLQREVTDAQGNPMPPATKVINTGD